MTWVVEYWPSHFTWKIDQWIQYKLGKQYN